MTDSTRTSRRRKPDRPKKPYPDFPLSPHASGAWQKKIRGKVHYFGRWARVVDRKLTRVPGDGWEDALRLYQEQRDDLHAGRTPRVKNKDGLEVRELCNRFLTAKKDQLEAGELSPISFAEYRATTDLLVSQFGRTRLVDDLAAPDFEALRASMARRLGPVRLGNEVQRVRTVFKYAYESGLMEKPMRFGPRFVKPSKTVMRKHRTKAGPKMFEAAEIRKLIGGAGVQMRAMVLLGVNAGYGNTDCATLPLSALGLDGGWVNYPRPKTGIDRRCPLWPETVEALRAVIAEREKPKGYDGCGLVFVNERGSPWVHIKVLADAPELEEGAPAGKRKRKGSYRTDNVTVQFGRLAKRVGVHRDGVGFYSLRHAFRTVADEVRDPVAIDLIMGHSDDSMGARYRERVDDSRLKAVTDHVRAWLWPKAEAITAGR